MSLLNLFMVLAATAEGGTAPGLSVAPGIECPSRSQLQRALDERFGPGKPGPDGGALLEVLRDDAGQLTVRLSTSSATSVAEKTFDAHVGSCAEVARTIALLTESWLRDLATPPELPPSAPDAGPPAKEVVIETNKVMGDQERPHALTLRLAGEAVVGNQVGVGGTVAVDVALSQRFGVGAELTVLGPVASADSGGGTVMVQRQEAALLATYALVAPASSRSPTVAALLGATVLRYAARAGGYPQSGNPTGIEPGLIFGLRGTLLIFQGFFVYGELDGHAVPKTLRFQVVEAAGSSATLVTQPPFWGSFSLGIGLHLL
jgi:hypothetical protein